MDPERIKRRQSLKVIISETIMTLTVIVTVIILALVVSGYWLNSDFEIERQGMLQVSSVPAGADVAIDGGSSWLQRTNTSKVLASDEHEVKLTKEEYDSWSKTIKITEGLLYRLRYPRLFPLERTKTTVYTGLGDVFATVSPTNNRMILTDKTTKWKLLSLENDTIVPETIDVSELFTGTDDGASSFAIEAVAWSNDESRLLIKTINLDSNIEWLLIDIRNPNNSLNITKLFNANFNRIEIIDDSASTLLAERAGNLHKINVSDKSISAILVSNVVDFSRYKNEIIYSAQKPVEGESVKYQVGILDLGNETTNKVTEGTAPSLVGIARFYDEIYIYTVEDNTLSVYNKKDVKLIESFELSFRPEKMDIGWYGDFVVMHSGQSVATLDMEARTVREWTLDGVSLGWLDKDMLFSINEGRLYVYDPDGLNRRQIAENVSNHFPAAITKDKWLYYFSDDDLIRENIVK